MRQKAPPARGPSEPKLGGLCVRLLETPPRKAFPLRDDARPPRTWMRIWNMSLRGRRLFASPSPTSGSRPARHFTPDKLCSACGERPPCRGSPPSSSTACAFASSALSHVSLSFAAMPRARPWGRTAHSRRLPGSRQDRLLVVGTSGSAGESTGVRCVGADVPPFTCAAG